MNIKTLLIVLLIIISGIFYYTLTEKKQEIHIIRVVDGDTLELENNVKIRLLGINTPEKNMLYYEKAKDFLANLLEGKKAMLEYFEEDKYGRVLGYIFYYNELVNKDILENGLASLYYYEHDRYYNEMEKAEEKARVQEKGIWKKSTKYGCLIIQKLKFKEKERCSNEEQLVLYNRCEKINALLKDDATHIYNEEIPSGIWEKNFSCIWNDEGDSLYAWDDSGLLIFYRY